MKAYGQFCGVAKALDVVGERWTLLVVRDLLLGPRRYSDLLAAMPGLTTNLLARRLKSLQAHGLVERRVLPPPAGSRVYALTDRGRELEAVVLALGRFGHAYLSTPAGDDRVDLRWAMVSLLRRYRGHPADPVRVLEWSIDGTLFEVRLGPEGVVVHDGAARHADLRVQTDLEGFRAAMFGGQRLSQQTGALQAGDPDVADQLWRGLFGDTPQS